MKRKHYRPPGMGSLMEASRQFDVGYQWLRQAVADGKLKTYQTEINSNVVLVKLDDIRALIEPKPRQSNNV